MATFDSTNGVTKSALDTSKFVPEIWADEIIATYKKSLVMANLVKKFSVVGKKGDAVNFPGFTRGAASAKSSLAQVTLQAHAGTGVSVSLNQHWEYSRLIEDIAAVQSNNSMRGVYTEDGGYALASVVDDYLWDLMSKWQSGAGTAAFDKAVIGTDGSTLYTGANEAAITDAAIRKVTQTLDDADVPMTNRSFAIPPVAKNTLMGLARFTEQAFVGNGSAIQTGKIGDIYGMPVYVSTMSPVATGAARIAAIFHRDALVLCEQQKPRVQTQYKQEFLSTLLTADCVFGAEEFRDNAGVAIAVLA
jgi:N4-gp56 family major capsid protein